MKRHTFDSNVLVLFLISIMVWNISFWLFLLAGLTTIGVEYAYKETMYPKKIHFFIDALESGNLESSVERKEKRLLTTHFYSLRESLEAKVKSTDSIDSKMNVLSDMVTHYLERNK